MSRVPHFHRLSRSVWLAMTIVLGLALLPAPIARAESSLGCLLADGATGSGSQMSVGSGMGFSVGEIITVEITNTSAGTTTATLYADGDGVASAAVPGTLVYVVEEPAPTGLRVEVDGQADFAFGCAEAGSELPEPSDEPASPNGEDFCDSGEAYGKYVSEKAKAGEKKGKDGYRPGEHRGFSTCVHSEGFGD